LEESHDVRFLEYEGKQLLSRQGIPIPRGILATTPSEVEAAVRELNVPVVIKAQVPMGGRGKAGGILFADHPGEAREIAKGLLGREIKGYPVNFLLVEEQVTVTQEIFISIVLDVVESKQMILLSSEGGIEIETLAEEAPERLVRHFLEPLEEMPIYVARDLLRKAGLSGQNLVTVANVLSNLAKSTNELDLTLAEINPLFILKDGRVQAGDAKLEMDDGALPRQRKALSELEQATGRPITELGVSQGARIAYEPLDGEIGILAGGAGLALATMDIVHLNGSTPADFLDFGGGGSAELIARALRKVLGQDSVRGVLMNAYGGINNCEVMAQGVVEVVNEDKPSVPIVVKMRGHFQEEGWALLEENNIPVIKGGTTDEAVKHLLALVHKKGGA
jgi:succinyl-CoA synthetase beta subunit